MLGEYIGFVFKVEYGGRKGFLHVTRGVEGFDVLRGVVGKAFGLWTGTDGSFWVVNLGLRPARMELSKCSSDHGFRGYLAFFFEFEDRSSRIFVKHNAAARRFYMVCNFVNVLSVAMYDGGIAFFRQESILFVSCWVRLSRYIQEFAV